MLGRKGGSENRFRIQDYEVSRERRVYLSIDNIDDDEEEEDDDECGINFCYSSE